MESVITSLPPQIFLRLKDLFPLVVVMLLTALHLQALFQNLVDKENYLT